jgi:heme exporter protein B
VRYLKQVGIIAGKDLLLEFHSRERLVSMFTFAVLVGVVFTFALDPAVRVRPIAGAMLWVTIIFAGMLSLGRSFSLEKEQDALVGILLTPIDRSALYLGKFLSNLLLLIGATIVVFFIFGLFFQLQFWNAGPALALVTLLGLVGFMALGTLFSAITANTRLGDTLLPIVLLPLLIPVIFFAAAATQRLLLGRPLEEVIGNVRMLLAFDVIFLVVCAFLFSAAVEE